MAEIKSRCYLTYLVNLKKCSIWAMGYSRSAMNELAWNLDFFGLQLFHVNAFIAASVMEQLVSSANFKDYSFLLLSEFCILWYEKAPGRARSLHVKLGIGMT